ncbi:nucleotidyltransferase family protein [Pararhizobium haloflavum]|uniref:nucleotidyltransferase family protein n=1 Tax=Pararhizobium haloflavum TaxID=2037914 RepID=UPI001FE1D9CE|nr:nucleotidyltransferase family protein [Pararhizobium haloflavum]
MGKQAIDRAMILAAGLGTRLRPITDTIPKPLVEVSGKALIDYGFDALRTAGIKRAVVNVHYRADQLRAHLKTVAGMQIDVSDETAQLLDSGGGVVNALPFLGSAPFVILNADTFWLEAPSAVQSNLQRMIEAFDERSMDILMLTVSPDRATGHDGGGDFTMDADGRLTRFDGKGDGMIYAGALIVHPRIFDHSPKGPFSLNACFDRALVLDRMRGLALAGHWLTVGTPQAIGEAERAIARCEAGVHQPV